MAFERTVEIALIAREKTRAVVKQTERHLTALQRTAQVVSAKMKAAFVSARSAIAAFGSAARNVMRRMRIGIIAAVAAGGALLIFLKKAIDSAKIQELAERKLEASFLGSGKATKAGIDSLKAYASQLQKTTKFGDEQIINAQAMLATFQLNDKQIKAATPRLLDMAAAMQQLSGGQVDLQQIAIAVGKGLTGQIGILSRYGVVISEEVKKSGDFNAILEELDKNFKGIAETVGSGTYVGAMKGVGNAWGDLKEKIGDIIIQSPLVLGFLNTLETVFERLQKEVLATKVELHDFVEKGIGGFVASVGNVIKAGVVIKAVFLGIKEEIGLLTEAYKSPPPPPLAPWVNKMLDKLPLVGERIKNWRKDLDDGLDSAAKATTGKEGFLAGVAADFKEVDKLVEQFRIKWAEAAGESAKKQKEFQEILEKLKPVTDDAAEAAAEMSDAHKKALDEMQKKYESTMTTIQESVSEMLFTRITKKGEEFKETMINIFRDMGNTIVRNITRQMAGGILQAFNIPAIIAGGGIIRGVGGAGVTPGLAGVGNLSNVITGTGGGIVGGVRGIANVGGGGGGTSSGALISPAASNMGYGIVSSAGRAVSGVRGALSGINPVSAQFVGQVAGGNVLSAGSLARLGFSGASFLARSAISGTGALSGIFASLLGRAGTRIVGAAGGLASGISGLASQFLPLGGLGRGGFSGIGGAGGSIGGALLGAALGGPVGAAIGSFGGGLLGRITGGLFGGGSNRNINLPGLPISSDFASRFGIPAGGISASSFRRFGPQIVAQSLALQGAARGVGERAQSFGLGNAGIINQAVNAYDAWGLTTSPADAGARNSRVAQLLEQADVFITNVEKLLSDAIVNAIETGFREVDTTAGFARFEDTLKSSVFENIVGAVTASLGNTDIMKSIMGKTVAPIAEFLAKQAGTFDISGFKSLIGGLKESPGFAQAKELFTGVFENLSELSKQFTTPVESLLSDAISRAISDGFAVADSTAGFEKFKASLKGNVFDNIVAAVTASLGNTTIMKNLLKKTVEPISEFLRQQGGGKFDVSGFQSLIGGIRAGEDFTEAGKLFSSVFSGLSQLSQEFGAGPKVAQTIRIPKLQHGGEIRSSGLVYAHAGERFSGIGRSRRDYINTENGEGININLTGAHINLSSSQNITTVAKQLGDKVRLEIKRARQFSGV